MYSCLQSALTWFSKNRLIVNTSKSTLLPVASFHNIQTSCNKINVHIAHTCLSSCSTTKLLGIYLDNTLSFKAHIEYLIKKICPKIGILHRLCHLLSIDILNIVYKTTIQPLIDYCLTVWGTSSKQNLKSIQRLQNRAARAVLGDFNFNSSVSAMIKQLNLLALPAPHTALYKRRFSYYGASLWNSLPSDLQTCNNIRPFKSQLSSYLK